jgi:hypothetical protein
VADTLSGDQARLIALWRQGLVDPFDGATPSRVQRMGVDARTRTVESMLGRLGAVQLDTISVLARSHELVAYSRFGAIGRDAVDRAYWDGETSFEYWSHAACILPMGEWPLFAFRRRWFARRGVRWHDHTTQAVAEVLAQLEGDGPLNTTHIGGAKRGGQWWDWSDAKVAIEWLLDIGTVVVTKRVGWRREYDLAKRVVPMPLRVDEAFVDEDGVVGPTDEHCVRMLVARSADAMGVGTADDIADVHRLSKKDVEQHADEIGLVRVTVEGWRQPAFATAESLAGIDSNPRAAVRTTLLSPFDSLIWYRPRMERLFGMAHRLEAYTPAHKRVHGYFAMPVLHQGQLVARVDPKRERSSLVARRVTFEATALRRDGTPKPAAVAGTAKALLEAASWVGATSVEVGDVVPAAAAPALRREVQGRHYHADHG